LFTAIAATIVVLPWAVDGPSGDGNPKPVAAIRSAVVDRARRR